jgi:hypothetical protein
MAIATDTIAIPTDAGANGFWYNAIVWISSSL